MLTRFRFTWAFTWACSHHTPPSGSLADSYYVFIRTFRWWFLTCRLIVVSNSKNIAIGVNASSEKLFVSFPRRPVQLNVTVTFGSEGSAEYNDRPVAARFLPLAHLSHTFKKYWSAILSFQRPFFCRHFDAWNFLIRTLKWSVFSALFSNLLLKKTNSALFLRINRLGSLSI